MELTNVGQKWKNMPSPTPYTNIDNIKNAEFINSPRNHEPEERILESRTNIMPTLDRLLPVLDAFGNIGHSGHKEGGKAPVPA